MPSNPSAFKRSFSTDDIDTIFDNNVKKNHQFNVESCLFLVLPIETLAQIFMGCSHKDICNIGRACHKLYEILADNYIWKQLWIREKWNEPQEPPLEPHFWKRRFIARISYEINWKKGKTYKKSLDLGCSALVDRYCCELHGTGLPYERPVQIVSDGKRGIFYTI
jgi:hypothetical protein